MRATFNARRKAAYEVLHPETAHGGDRNSSRKLCDLRERSEAPRFTADTADTADTAAKTGQSERLVQLNAERGEKVSPAALAMIKGTRLDTGKYLDKLKAMPVEKQTEVVKGDLRQPKTPRIADDPARRKAAYEVLHPETAHGKASPSKDDNLSSFAEDQSAKTGVAKRTVQRNAARGEKVSPAALAMIKGTLAAADLAQKFADMVRT